MKLLFDKSEIKGLCFISGFCVAMMIEGTIGIFHESFIIPTIKIVLFGFIGVFITNQIKKLEKLKSEKE